MVLDCGLTEELKWGVPCYHFELGKIILIHVFKEYCALLFFKGALLHDAKKVLIQQTKNVQAARQMRFTNSKEIVEMAASIKAYIYEAIEVEKAGITVPLKETAAFEMPEEFQQALDNDPKLLKAFKALTPGRQRGYLLFFAAPKQANTKLARVEKYRQQIMEGKGVND
ncbi:YdeI family protein [Ferruginibacter sp.]|uniref:YdeI/OmpD-associated family protein n=1 Tax=Ferruginibacter sp. TaxID=1940288 RepID=UPI00265840AA|nr:YdeI/OmpD-associated family protein [Ferruginibacter sp.]